MLFKKDRGKRKTGQAVHLSSGQMECADRACIRHMSCELFSVCWLTAGDPSGIPHLSNPWYPLRQDGSGWSLTTLGLPGEEKKANRDASAPSPTTGLLLLSLNWAYRWSQMNTQAHWDPRPLALMQTDRFFFFFFLSLLTYLNTDLLIYLCKTIHNILTAENWSKNFNAILYPLRCKKGTLTILWHLRPRVVFPAADYDLCGSF